MRNTVTDHNRFSEQQKATEQSARNNNQKCNNINPNLVHYLIVFISLLPMGRAIKQTTDNDIIIQGPVGFSN